MESSGVQQNTPEDAFSYISPIGQFALSILPIPSPVSTCFSPNHPDPCTNYTTSLAVLSASRLVGKGLSSSRTCSRCQSLLPAILSPMSRRTTACRLALPCRSPHDTYKFSFLPMIRKCAAQVDPAQSERAHTHTHIYLPLSHFPATNELPSWARHLISLSLFTSHDAFGIRWRREVCLANSVRAHASPLSYTNDGQLFLCANRSLWQCIMLYFGKCDLGCSYLCESYYTDYLYDHSQDTDILPAAATAVAPQGSKLKRVCKGAIFSRYCFLQV